MHFRNKHPGRDSQPVRGNVFSAALVLSLVTLGSVSVLIQVI